MLVLLEVQAIQERMARQDQVEPPALRALLALKAIQVIQERMAPQDQVERPVPQEMLVLSEVQAIRAIMELLARAVQQATLALRVQ